MSGGKTSGGHLTVGLDVGGTKLLAAVVDEDGTILAEKRAPSPHGWPDMRDALVDLVCDVSGSGATGPVEAVGVGAAGMVDLDGRIHYAPNIPGFRKVNVRDELSEALGLPVAVDNDANAAAWGESRYGAARGMRNALVITLGTGIGGGILMDGHVLRGAHGFAAEIGHFTVDPNGPMCACGERGHWEAVASGNALGRMAREAAAAGAAPSVLHEAGGDPAAVTGMHVTAAAALGEPDALGILDRYAFNVALGLVGLANILDPEVVVISGGLVNDGDLILEPIRRHFLGHIEGAAFRPRPAIVPAELGERAGVVGAAALARDLLH